MKPPTPSCFPPVTMKTSADKCNACKARSPGPAQVELEVAVRIMTAKITIAS